MADIKWCMGLSGRPATEQSAPTVFNELAVNSGPRQKSEMNKCVRGLGTTEGCPVGHVYLAVSEKASVEERKRDSVHSLEEES